MPYKNILYIHAIIRDPTDQIILTKDATGNPTVFNTRLWSMTKMWRKGALSGETSLREALSKTFNLTAFTIIRKTTAPIYGDRALIYEVSMNTPSYITIPSNLLSLRIPISAIVKNREKNKTFTTILTDQIIKEGLIDIR